MAVISVAGHNGLTTSAAECKNDVSSAAYAAAGKINVETDGTYALGIAMEKSHAMFAVSLSNRTIQCFSAEHQINLRTLSGHGKPITRIKYSRENSALLYSSSFDGNICLWDMREKSLPVLRYIDDSNGILKPICSFDFSLDENYICGGTELVREDAFMIFWDRRMGRNLGGYWNSHTEDITQVHYHPYRNCVMATGSTDGLINVFDLSRTCEDDALQLTLNTGSSVGHLMWKSKVENEFNHDNLACVTHTEEMQLWNIEEASPQISLDRDILGKLSNDNIEYLVDTIHDSESTYVVSGQRNGNIQIWKIGEGTVSLWSRCCGMHTEEVRAVAWNPEDKTLFTCGEDGIVCTWKPEKSSTIENYKMMSRMKELSLKHSKKPY